VEGEVLAPESAGMGSEIRGDYIEKFRV